MNQNEILFGLHQLLVVSLNRWLASTSLFDPIRYQIIDELCQPGK